MKRNCAEPYPATVAQEMGGHFKTLRTPRVEPGVGGRVVIFVLKNKRKRQGAIKADGSGLRVLFIQMYPLR